MRAIFISSLLLSSNLLIADGEPQTEIQRPFSAFTGKILKNKVRMRALPTLDAEVVRELGKGDLLIVTGETEDFYSILPPTGSKAYIFRTFVLDNVIEGSRVNVRIEPTVDATIIAQLNTGDKVNGAISPLNAKWLEIPMPSTARFYIAKDLVEKIGDAHLMATLAKRKEEINLLLSNTYLISQDEMQKNYPEVKLEGIVKNYNQILDQAKEYPEQAAKAKEHLKILQDNYLQKKIAYLEAKAEMNAMNYASMPQPSVIAFDPNPKKSAISSKMTAWNEAEILAFNEWTEEHAGEPIEAFYKDQQDSSKTLKGLIEPYNKAIKNKPGDFVLVNQSNHGIIAYLYSNQINLAEHTGQEVTLKAAPRPNNNFAFPAYYVLEVQE